MLLAGRARLRLVRRNVRRHKPYFGQIEGFHRILRDHQVPEMHRIETAPE
jgi:hypothetical protein